MSNEIDALISEANQIGLTEAIRLLKEERVRKNVGTHEVLTIVGNRGIHLLPPQIARGYVYYASEGNLDFSTKQSVEREISRIVENVAKTLRAKEWKRIYLVPFGHAIVIATIKLAVYRVCHLETIDLFYHKDGTYSDIEIQTREIVGAI